MKKSRKKYPKYLGIFLAFIAVCFLLPEYPEYPRSTHSAIDEMKLNSAGDRLLVRTGKYDYDFTLPANTLSLALAPLQHSSPANHSDTPWYAHGDLSPLQINTDGSFSSRLTVTFIGYDPELRPFNIGLPSKEIARLEKYGFTRIKNEYTDEFNATWSANVTAHQHDHDSLGAYSGADILTCCSTDLKVILDTEEKMEHNRHLNAMLRPVTVIKDAVKNVIWFPIALIFVLFGFGGTPRG